MKGMRIGLVAAAAALSVGCASFSPPSVPGQEPPQDTAQEPADAPEVPTYAGTWTRRDGGHVFDVTDDGTTVHGELRDAAGHGFDSYAFDLTRKGDALEGAAKFVLSDVSDRTYETKWRAKLDGATILVNAEELGIDDENEVAERTPIEHVYDFAPAAPATFTPPPMPTVDMSAYVTPAPSYEHLLADDIAVGQWVDVETDAIGNRSVTRTAVVADAGDAWVIELDNQVGQKDLLLAVFVHKETGDVLKAFVGNRGGEGTEKPVTPQATQDGEAPPTTEEEVTVPAGTFMAKRVDTALPDGSTMSTWVGLEGTEAEGVMLRTQGPSGTDELETLEATTFEAGSTVFEARRLVYTSGNEMVMALSPRPWLNQVMLQTRMSGVAMRLVAQGDDAQPAFDYPR